MAKNKKVTKDKSLSNLRGFKYIANDTTQFIFGFLIICISLYIFIAFCSYMSTGNADQSLVLYKISGQILDTKRNFQNSCGSIGALISYFLIARCFGYASFIIPIFIFICGIKLIKAYHKTNLWKWFLGSAIAMLWLSITLSKTLSSIMGNNCFSPGGDHGDYMVELIEGVIGSPGLITLLVLILVAYLTYITSETIIVIRKLLNPIGYIRDKVKFTVVNHPSTSAAVNNIDNKNDNTEKNIVIQNTELLPNNDKSELEEISSNDIYLNPKYKKEDKEISLTIDRPHEEEKASGKILENENKLSTTINPHEPFVNWKYPTLNLLKEYDSDKHINYVDQKELEANKNRIIEVLNDFGVQIKSIRATVGPTITLYEIAPAQGIRISKIKNLEDDIALSLAAIGIRIIAPMPGKGTIGIEVPNAKPSIVSIYSILNSKKFQNSTMELPIALGKTITNDVFMVDLAKIPHLLVAGATGQGKSVGLNAILTSLLYKKHPNDLKIVLVDPKKVEFSVYSPIAKPFMAAIQDNEDEPIITDVQKVVKTLKGLCTLMDKRYDLLKTAGARNIKEYNKKYLNHLLNPTDGHEFMPYIVVVIDEFGDLILTAGKEIEMPIARIAQLARAVGIHMVIATQRPTTSIITGNIKANFPGRIAFRVGAMIDSRTIIDRSGAQQLVGRGDMLYLNGGEPIRVQCAFVDTPEVENITNFISNQPGPVSPLEIPEPASDDESSTFGTLDTQSIDPLFEEAARTIVINQQGSTSMIQRRFSIGYNRAGRLMDQMEKAGIVGAAQGSKPREVLISDEETLTSLLNALHR